MKWSDFVVDRMRWLVRAKGGSAAVMQTLLTRIFLLFINLLNGVFTARHFGAAGRGTQAAIGLWLPILMFILTFGVPNALRFQGRRHESERGGLFGASILFGTGSGVLALIVGVVAMPALMHQYDLTSIQDARYIMLFAPLGTVTLVFTAMLEVRLDFALSNLTRYVPPMVTFVVLVTLASVHRLTPFSAVLAYVVPPAFISIVMGIYLVRVSPPTLRDFRRSMRRLLGYGIRIFGADVLGTFSQQIDQLLVVGLLSPSGLGAYTIALQASRVLTIFQVSLNSVLLPKAAGLPTHEIIKLVARTARLTIAVTAVAACALIALLPFLLPNVYGHDFRAAVVVSQVLAVEAVFSAAAGTHTQVFLATNRPGMATLFQFGGLATSIPMMLILIPRLGLVGAALALLTSTILRLILALASYPILLKASIPKLVVSRADVSYLIRMVTGAT